MGEMRRGMALGYRGWISIARHAPLTRHRIGWSLTFVKRQIDQRRGDKLDRLKPHVIGVQKDAPSGRPASARRSLHGAVFGQHFRFLQPMPREKLNGVRRNRAPSDVPEMLS